MEAAVPEISYIVNAYNRPLHLPTVIGSLLVQTHQDFEILVIDNSPNAWENVQHEAVVKMDAHERIRYFNPRLISCYHACEFGAEQSTGEYLCFPSDDGYYMPEFGAALLYACRNRPLDMAFCEVVHDRRCNGVYGIFNTAARCGQIDKGCFILHRSKFNGFPTKPCTDRPCPADGEMVDMLVRDGVVCGKVDEILAVHN